MPKNLNMSNDCKIPLFSKLHPPVYRLGALHNAKIRIESESQLNLGGPESGILLRTITVTQLSSKPLP
jgi:hypothetical protein